MTEEKFKFRVWDKILLDIRECLGKIEMKIKRLLNKKFYDSLSENDIPKDTFYCY